MSSLKQPHIAFMERRNRSKPRVVSSGDEDSKMQVWGPALPEPDDLTQMQPFVTGPAPHFLLMKRYNKKQVKGTKKSIQMSYKPLVSLSKQR